jgi:methylenetetrahydrofolate dehydrogenase (NADP+) / methenyltetrahydrofolate cyclohydrolase
MATILNGKALGLSIREKIKLRVAALPSQPKLAVVLVGDDPASHVYVGLKETACEEAGIGFEMNLYESDVSEEVLLGKIAELNEDKDVHGILVQLPLPSQDASRIIQAIDPLKDVDGFHPENLEKLRRGEPTIASAVALGVMKLIRHAVGEDEISKTATIVASPLFAEPIKILLSEQGASVTVTQAEDTELASKTVDADILVVAEGEPGLIIGEMVKPGAIVIDVGTTKVNGVLKGDVDFDTVESVAGALTPVPGGVGPMTVAMLLVNMLKAFQLQQK